MRRICVIVLFLLLAGPVVWGQQHDVKVPETQAERDALRVKLTARLDQLRAQANSTTNRAYLEAIMEKETPIEHQLDAIVQADLQANTAAFEALAVSLKRAVLELQLISIEPPRWKIWRLPQRIRIERALKKLEAQK